MPRTCSLPISTEWSHQTMCQPRFGHQTTRGDHSGGHVFKLRNQTGRNLANVLRLGLQRPGFAGLNPVLPRDGPVDRPTLVWRRRWPVGFIPGSCTPNPAPLPPHARGRNGTTRGSSASQPPVVFRPYPPWVVGAGSGRVPGPKFAAGTAAGAAGGFLGRREGQKSVGFCPLGGAHQSAWSLYIVLGHTPRRRCPAGA